MWLQDENICEGCSSVMAWPQPAAKPHAAARSLPHSGMEEWKKWKVKVKKFKRCNKDTLIRRAKATYTRKANEGINLSQQNKEFPIPSLCMGRHFAWHRTSCGVLSVPLIWSGIERLKISFPLSYWKICKTPETAERWIHFLFEIEISPFVLTWSKSHHLDTLTMACPTFFPQEFFRKCSSRLVLVFYYFYFHFLLFFYPIFYTV